MPPPKPAQFSGPDIRRWPLTMLIARERQDRPPRRETTSAAAPGESGLSAPAYSTSRPRPTVLRPPLETMALEPAQPSRPRVTSSGRLGVASDGEMESTGLGRETTSSSAPNGSGESTPANSTSRPPPTSCDRLCERSRRRGLHSPADRELPRPAASGLPAMGRWHRVLGADRDDFIDGSRSVGGVHSGRQHEPTATCVLRPPWEAMLPRVPARLGEHDLRRSSASELAAWRGRIASIGGRRLPLVDDGLS